MKEEEDSRYMITIKQLGLKTWKQYASILLNTFINSLVQPFILNAIAPQT